MSAVPWDPESGMDGGTDGGDDDFDDGEGEGDEGADPDPGDAEGESCVDGEVRACTCADTGEVGSQACSGAGTFGACECGQEPVDPGTPPEPPPGDPDPGDDPPPPDPDPPPAGATEACYPGADNSGTTCLPIHVMAMPPGYDYPAGFNGDPNYRPPIALLDLEQVDPSTQIAPNFQLDEIAQLAKGRYAIVQPHAIATLQALRDEVGPIGINSGYRSPSYNAGIGGATYSRHMYGDGFDMDPVNVSLGVLEAACNGQGGMLVEYNTHVHCDFRFDDADVGFFGAPGPGMFDEPAFGATIAKVADGTFEAPADGFDEGEPTRHWVAFDADGFVLATAQGTTFEAPVGTARVEVEVGRLLVRSYDVP